MSLSKPAIAVGATAILVGASIGYLYYANKKSSTVQVATRSIRSQSLPNADDVAAESARAAQREAFLETIRALLTPTPEVLKHIEAVFREEMLLGLENTSGTELKMIPTYLEKVPDGSERGSYYALDLGGTNFRVLKCELHGPGDVRITKSSQKTIPMSAMKGNAIELFDFIAQSVAEVANPKEGTKLGLTFSFPVNQTAINAGTLINWTKGFTADGVVGEDVVQLLQEAFQRLHIDVDVVALANDTVGTLASSGYIDAKSLIGVILGTGSNACYLEKVSNIKKWANKGVKAQNNVINIEWGNFDSIKKRALPFTKYDVYVDEHSPNVGQQRLEKLVSGMYLGEIVRLILLDMIDQGILFVNQNTDKLRVQETFGTKYCSLSAGDFTTNLVSIEKFLLEDFDLVSTNDEREIIKELSFMVGQRSAFLATVGITAILHHLEHKDECTVGIDGSVFEKFPNYPKLMKRALVLLDADLAPKVNLVLAKDGSGIGVALIAAAVSKLDDGSAQAEASQPTLIEPVHVDITMRAANVTDDDESGNAINNNGAASPEDAVVAVEADVAVASVDADVAVAAVDADVAVAGAGADSDAASGVAADVVVVTEEAANHNQEEHSNDNNTREQTPVSYAAAVASAAAPQEEEEVESF